MHRASNCRSPSDGGEASKHEGFFALGLIPITQMMTRIHRQLHTHAINRHFQLSDVASLISHYRTESTFSDAARSFDRTIVCMFDGESRITETRKGDNARWKLNRTRCSRFVPRALLRPRLCHSCDNTQRIFRKTFDESNRIIVNE